MPETMLTGNRFDKIDAPAWMYSKFAKTPEGYLKGRAVVCTTGVYEYRKADGSVVKELRLPEEVFAKSFLDSLELRPLTLLHPDVMLNADNIKQFQIGTLGNNPSAPSGTAGDPSLAADKQQTGYQFYNTDMYHVAIDMIIHDAEAVKAVEAGTRELSVGYTCDLEPADPDARWCGQTYDFIQRNIKANHVSLVPKARAGDSARIRLDSASAELISLDTSKEDIYMPTLKKIVLDGVEYESEPKVLEALHTATVRADTVQGTLDALIADKTKIDAERDTLKDKVDTLEAKVKELETVKLDTAVIDAAVARRVRILDAARVANVEVKADMAELDIQKAVIMAVFPKAVLDGKDAVYLDARFDGAVEALSVEAEKKADAEIREVSGGVEKADTSSVPDSQKKREEYMAKIRSGYLGVKK
jgi:hypothetical protein